MPRVLLELCFTLPATEKDMLFAHADSLNPAHFIGRGLMKRWGFPGLNQEGSLSGHVELFTDSDLPLPNRINYVDPS